MEMLREIKKMGGSNFIALKPKDLDDFSIEVGDYVDIKNIEKKNRKTEIENVKKN